MRWQRLLLFIQVFSTLLFVSLGTMELVEYDDKQQLTCSLGFAGCAVVTRDEYEVEAGEVYVTGLSAQTVVCHLNNEAIAPCLQINATVQGPLDDPSHSGEEEDEGRWRDVETSGDRSTDRHTSTIRVCYQLPAFSGCTFMNLMVSPPNMENQSAPQLWVSLVVSLRKGDFGSTAVVYSFPTLMPSPISHPVIEIPSLETVCSSHQNLVQCKVAILHVEIDWGQGLASLRLDDSAKGRGNELQLCKQLEREGDCQKLEWDGHGELKLPLSSVGPCLCFQVWWRGSLRNEYCPFQNHTALLRSKVVVSVAEAQTHSDGMIDSEHTALAWNITAPCRLEVQLWPCRKGSGVGCQAVSPLPQASRPLSEWMATHHGHWMLRGEFVPVERHPSLCVQIKVKGLEDQPSPVCPFEVSRARWSLPVLLCLFLMCLAVIVVYVMQSSLKGCVQRWLKADDIKPAVGGGHVVLLYPADADEALKELLCGLGTSLCALGFSVSLDLWSRPELGALGPVPWLHSRLDRLQRQGGKVVLVLTHSAWERAREWSRQGREREEWRGEEMEEAGGGRGSLPCTDVFDASLSCVLADYLQGRAGERFLLVQFEARPAGPPGGGGSLPELFRGLSLYSLPSQSLGFLTDLAQGAQRRRLGNIRGAAWRRAQAGGLRGLTGAAGKCHLVGFPQDCVGFGKEDLWESIPLQQSSATPPYSPELSTKAETVDWV